MKIRIWKWFRILAIGTCILLLFHTYMFIPIIVNGNSMLPNLYDKDRVVLNKMETSFERFDIVVIKYKNRSIIKRIIGLPGDQIQYKKDILYINGKPITEPHIDNEKELYNSNKKVYTKDFTLYELTGKITVPSDSIFVLGDNRPKSLDSRTLGFFQIDDIIGKAYFRYYPFTRIKASIND